ncbi:DUF4382 domain-containing protein [Aliiglaciecola sp. 2_MG-2023]|uniref:DUF4382 domain-containing protein n=1 Tax=Alteromonadaceae TaxID=72275 RepID=UPI0026E1BCA8|nr:MULTISPECIES: DUF4382 domain-containing protein [unclassified Aliiglaciecola]MDO6709605.1 DUF4382 domain-containing protein [Aliiglaciecola sp. 2_MG-2023]MDO6750853.1 DUF4382 domain-containing protein [Aliiglaciecola sp. 1_MG-2023]
MIIKPLHVSLLCFIAMLSACGSNDDALPIFAAPVKTTLPSFSLAVSDAPADGLADVILCFSTITLKGEEEDLTFKVGDPEFALTANDLCLDDTNNVVPNAVGIDLLEYTGSLSIPLVEEINIQAGQYSQISLGMTDGSYTVDKLKHTKNPITIASNEITFDGFTVTENNTADFTVEFDLRNALTNPVGQDEYFLQSTGIRLVDNQQAGQIKGQVSETLLINQLCEPLADINGSPAVVYLYEGMNLESSKLADNGGLEQVLPFASTSVYFDASQTTYPFDIGFVPYGSYTLALSCDLTDDPELDDEVGFVQIQEVSIDDAKTEGVVNFEDVNE